jgi:multiple sugar transport system substrate-binding protein
MRVRFATPAGAALLSVLLLLLTGCGGLPERGSHVGTTCTGELTGPGPVYLTAWFHTRTPAEARTMRRQVAAFNAAQREVQVKLTEIPVASYASVVMDAAASGNLPDILDFDGPYLYNYAYYGMLAPLDSCIPARLRADLLPSIRQQGSSAGQVYGIGTADSGLGLFVRPSALRKIGARMPTGVTDAWTAREFTRILGQLRRAGYRQPLDLQMNAARPGGSREWFSYGFAPVIWSAGGDLINRSTYRTARGVLNSPASVRALSTVQSWFRAGLVNPNPDGTAFAGGQAAVSWGGSWMYDRYHTAFRDDLKIVPLPRFGARPSSGLGSWQWGISSNTIDGDAAWRFLSYLLQTPQVLRLARASGAIPATRAAISRAPVFASGGPEHLYVQQLEDGIARPRPQTPAYPAITAAFSAAFLDIARGGNVRRALDDAVARIDRNLAAHRYYQPSEP